MTDTNASRRELDQLKIDLDQLSGKLHFQADQYEALRLMVAGLALITLITAGTIIGQYLATRDAPLSLAE